MRSLLVIFGILFLVLITVVGAFIGYGIYVGTGLDASSKAYVDANVPTIIASWSKDEMIKRSSPELRKMATDEQIEQFFSKLAAQLGSFKSYDGSKGDANISYTTGNGKVVTATYMANATFENGKVEISIKLIQVNGEWKFFGFHVNPVSAS